jgi:CheY-like chemotaxis protein
MTVDQELGFIACDPRKLERVLTNIVKNAIKFNREGGSIQVQAWVTQDEEQQPWVCVCVDDTGIGIAPEHLPHITKRFYRVGEYVSGSGLGLYISKDLVERQGGSLHIESPPPGKNTGTRVSIYLPLITPPTVVLIYQDEHVKNAIEAALSDEGYDVKSAQAGSEAEVLLTNIQPEVLLLDWSGSDMRGAAIIAAVKAHAHLAAIPTLVITGKAESPAKNEILRGFQLPTLSESLSKQTILSRLDKTLADSQAT